MKTTMAVPPAHPGLGVAAGVILVLAHGSDAGAASVAASVRNLLGGPVEVWCVRPESLVIKGRVYWISVVVQADMP